MATVTYRSQPAIDRTQGHVPLRGTAYLYTVRKRLWPDEVEDVLRGLLIGRSLHVCCGASLLGDVRLDIDPTHNPDITCDAANMRGHVGNGQFDTVLCDPPYNGKYRWNHDLLSELARVAGKRIIFQHWFIPVDRLGRFKKDHEFVLSELYAWQPRSYFGRAQIISVMDRIGSV